MLVGLVGWFTVCLVIGCWFDVLFILVGNDCYYVMALVGCFECEWFWLLCVLLGLGFVFLLVLGLLRFVVGGFGFVC